MIVPGGQAAAQRESGWLGVSLTHTITVQGTHTNFASVVEAVLANSPASDAGISKGDTIVSMNGKQFNRANIGPIVRGIRPGEKVTMQLRRGGQLRNIELVAGRRPQGAIVLGPAGHARMLSVDSVRAFTRSYVDSANAGMRTLSGRLHAAGRGFEEVSVYRTHEHADLAPRGVTVVTPAAPIEGLFSYAGPGSFFFDTGHRAVAGAEFLELNADWEATLGRDDGLLVLRVADRTPAQRAGLRPGDLVVGAAGNRVRVLRDLRVAVAQARAAVPLNVLRNKKKVELTLTATN